jgi:hypothetical protein
MIKALRPGETPTAPCQRSRSSLSKTNANRVSSHSVLLGLFILAASVAASSRQADAAPRRVLLLPFEGPSAVEVQSVVRSSLSSDVTTIPPDQAERAFQLLNARGDNPPDRYAALARRLKAMAVIEGKVLKDDRWRLRLSIRKGATGTVAGTVAWSGASFKEMAANVQRGAPYWMQSMLDAAEEAPGAVSARPVGPLPVGRRAPVAVVEEAAPSRPARTSTRAAASSQEEGPPLPMWEVSLGPRVLTRNFTYTDNLEGLPGYTLAGAPALAADATFFPTAGGTSAARNFGFAGHFETSVAVKTVGRNGAASADTSLRAYLVGARYRIPSNHFLFTVGADYGEHRFNIDVQDVAPPNVRYTILRPSLTTRADAGGNLSLSVTLAYLHILGVGDMGADDRFPRDTAVGAEASAGLAYAVDENFSVQLVVDVRHFAHTMHAQMGDKLLVGGAVDDNFGASLLISYRSR